ncbi:AMP-binding protein [Novosphingobium sp. KCTC 2891]|uniref:AMP-binding protein n=1 Tax=Novosphingobium sp. KCTC 2891 TaxID=2989730 RepID=UPI002221DBA0|nr:AMP-binding protein [Novosphingobium sp. KCTC 2891]MCW1384899.1 AMP-binding protein [Novosphingobium sp. KCTC 2891]
MSAALTLDHDRLTTLWEVVDYHASVRGDADAIQFEGHTITYAGLREAALRLAAGLAATGVGRGSRVAYLGKNGDRYFVLLFALARIGAVMVPLNWRLAAEEWGYIVRDAGVMRLFCDSEFGSPAATLAAACGLPGAETIPADPQGAHAITHVPLPGPSDTVFQVYTSGTTGHPKGALLTNANLLALRAPGYRAGLEWFPQPETTMLVVLPVAHIAGTAYALFGFYAGARIALAREFDPVEVLSLIERERADYILLAPAAMQLLMDCPAAARTDFGSLRYITYGAAPIPEVQLQQALKVFGCGFVQMYGMSEASGGVVALDPGDHVCGIPGRLRSAGRAMPGVEVGVMDDGGALLPPDTTGEIVVRSAAVMSGYWNLPQATAETLTADGWLRTGDIGRIDEEGYVYVLDRAKDMIISGGENVYPAEVENAVFSHPDVADVAVIGVPSARWGEEVAAIVVPRPGADPRLEDIQEWVGGRLARFKVPRHLYLAESLPRNAGNKILRRMLREPFWQGHDRRVN